MVLANQIADKIGQEMRDKYLSEFKELPPFFMNRKYSSCSVVNGDELINQFEGNLVFSVNQEQMELLNTTKVDSMSDNVTLATIDAPNLTPS